MQRLRPVPKPVLPAQRATHANARHEYERAVHVAYVVRNVCADDAWGGEEARGVLV